jgi:hypothetical protein
MLRCVVVSVSREVRWVIDGIDMITKVRAGHIHRAVLPKFILNPHRYKNQRGINAAAAD